MSKINFQFFNNKLKLVVGVSIILSSLVSSITLNTNAKTLSILNQFTYGVSTETQEFPNSVNLVAGPWVLNDWQAHNTTWLSKFNQPKNITKIPYLYLYITAGKARADAGLQDCNVGADKSKTLCYAGANYIRNNYNTITQAYINSAINIKNIYGNQKEIALHIEPDFYQYTYSDQIGGGLSSQDATNAINKWTTAIKQILPNSTLVMDVSPWNNDLQGWSSKMQNFDYAGLVGKRFSPQGDGSVYAGIDGKTYAQISSMTGKRLIINDSIGAGGYPLPFNYQWVNQTLAKERFNDGVIAVIQPSSEVNSLDNIIKPNTKNITTESSGTDQITQDTNKIIVLPTPKQLRKPVQPAIIQAQTTPSEIQNTINLENETTNQNIIFIDQIKNPNEISCIKNEIEFTLSKSGSWENGFTSMIKIKNKSNKDIQGWDLKLNLLETQNLFEIWNLNRNSNVFSGNANWNTNIKAGQEFNVGGFNINSKYSELPNMSCDNINIIY